MTSVLIVTKPEETNDSACEADCSLREVITSYGLLTVGHMTIDQNQAIEVGNSTFVTHSIPMGGNYVFSNQV